MEYQRYTSGMSEVYQWNLRGKTSGISVVFGGISVVYQWNVRGKTSGILEVYQWNIRGIPVEYQR